MCELSLIILNIKAKMYLLTLVNTKLLKFKRISFIELVFRSYWKPHIVYVLINGDFLVNNKLIFRHQLKVFRRDFKVKQYRYEK